MENKHILAMRDALKEISKKQDRIEANQNILKTIESGNWWIGDHCLSSELLAVINPIMKSLVTEETQRLAVEIDDFNLNQLIKEVK